MKPRMAASGMRGNSFRFIGEEELEELFVGAGERDVAGAAFSFFAFCFFFAEGMIQLFSK